MPQAIASLERSNELKKRLVYTNALAVVAIITVHKGRQKLSVNAKVKVECETLPID